MQIETMPTFALDFAGWSASRQSADVFYRRILATHGKLFFDGSCWLVVDYDVIKRIVSDETHFSARLEQPHRSTHPLMNLLAKQAIFLDGADHRRIQRLIQVPLARFTRPNSSLLLQIETIVHTLLETLSPQGKMDLARDFAEPMTDLVMAQLMGIPCHDQARLRLLMEGADAFGDITSGYTRTSVRSIDALCEALRQLIHVKRARPADDLLSVLVSEPAATPSSVFQDEDELMATILMLLGAGRVTAKKVLVDGSYLLLDQWDHVRAEVQAHPRRINTLVEYLLCCITPTSYIARWAREDIQIGDQVMRAGQKVLLFLEAGNHLSVCCSPSSEAPFDIQHPLPRPHFAFGPPGDPHVCVGAGLAREELRRAFAGLLKRFSGLSLQPGAQLSFHPNPNIGGLVSLPVQWERR